MPKAFITSATGTVGGALARQLRALGWDVSTTTRNPSSPAAQDLAARGVSVAAGDWDDSSVLAASLAGAEFLFVNLFPDLVDTSRESARAKLLLRLAHEAGVGHVVYSSILPGPRLPQKDEEKDVSLPYRRAKKEIETAVTTVGIDKWTIIRPGYFMANFLKPKVDFQFPGAADTGRFALTIDVGTALPLVDHEDIAAFAVAAFLNPEKFDKQTIALAGEWLALERCIEGVAQTAGRELKWERPSAEEIQGLEPMRKFMLENQRSLVGLGGLVDLDEVARWGVPTGTFARFLERQAEDVKASYQKAPAK
jgi:uncharacterized protein YbjT (DUF2867 family)